MIYVHIYVHVCNKHVYYIILHGPLKYLSESGGAGWVRSFGMGVTLDEGVHSRIGPVSLRHKFTSVSYPLVPFYVFQVYRHKCGRVMELWVIAVEHTLKQGDTYRQY